VTGACHCGAVRFQVVVRSTELVECNCSVCNKKGFLHLIVPEGDFELRAGAEHLSTYEFNTRIAKHRFCKTCGIHPFYRPRSHPDAVSVNARCLDDVDLGAFTVVSFDGRHWEDNVHRIR
jgi:hypothetical protein